MKLQGQITISSINGQEVEVEIKDHDSRVLFVRARMPMNVFGRIVSGYSYQPCLLDVKNLHKIGKVMETRYDDLKVPHGENPLKERAVEALRLVEKDGWEGNLKDATNSHRIVSREETYTTYRVAFRRWVDATKETREVICGGCGHLFDSRDIAGRFVIDELRSYVFCSDCAFPGAKPEP